MQLNVRRQSSSCANLVVLNKMQVVFSASPGNLYTHMRKHTGQFYRCEQCSFKTTNKGHLVEHEATHTGRRHACDMCHKDYNTVKSLQNHVRKYHLHLKTGRDYLARFQMKTNKVTHHEFIFCFLFRLLCLIPQSHGTP